MLYTLLDRKNPSGIVQFILFTAPSSIYTDDRVIKEIKEKRVKYIIVQGSYTSSTKIVQYIYHQKHIATIGPYALFEIIPKK